jgi:hypothetical protein
VPEQIGVPLHFRGISETGHQQLRSVAFVEASGLQGLAISVAGHCQVAPRDIEPDAGHHLDGFQREVKRQVRPRNLIAPDTSSPTEYCSRYLNHSPVVLKTSRNTGESRAKTGSDPIRQCMIKLIVFSN